MCLIPGGFTWCWASESFWDQLPENWDLFMSNQRLRSEADEERCTLFQLKAQKPQILPIKIFVSPFETLVLKLRDREHIGGCQKQGDG